MKKSNRIALGGIISALSLLMMFLTGIFPFAEYALPAIAGVILVILVLEINKKTAYLAFIVVSLLALIVTPNKEAAILFLFFFGYYPILKSSIEQIKSIALEWVVKFLIFNVTICLGYFVAINLFGLEQLVKDLSMGFEYGILVLLLLGNVAFLLYDKVISGLVTKYLYVIKPKLKFLNK